MKDYPVLGNKDTRSGFGDALHELTGIKAKAGTAWQEQHELLFQQMNQNGELVFEKALLF